VAKAVGAGGVFLKAQDPQALDRGFRGESCGTLAAHFGRVSRIQRNHPGIDPIYGCATL
jgi:hypothetical protein